VEIRLKVHILDGNEDQIDSLAEPESQITSGSIQVDITQPVSRSLEMVVVDQPNKLAFESNNPAHGAVFADHFIRVNYEVWVEDVIGDWVIVPVFEGPIASYRRIGAEVTVTALGKESLMLDPYLAVQSYTIRERTRLDDAIRKVGKKAGARKFDLPDLNHKLRHPRVVHATDQPWLVIKGGGEDDNGKEIPGLASKSPHTEREVFFNGRGELCMRRMPKQPCFTFRRIAGRNDNHLTSEPDRSFDTDALRNYVIVEGENPNGKENPKGHATLPAHNPYSPQKLAWNGVPRELVHSVSAGGLSTQKQCEKRAEEILKRMVLEGFTASFSCLPVIHLEERDIVRLRTEEYDFEFPIRQMTIPLTNEDMSVNAFKKVRPRRQRDRHPELGGVGPGHGGRGSSHRKPRKGNRR
jgi:hypothetical protein